MKINFEHKSSNYIIIIIISEIDKNNVVDISIYCKKS